MRVFTSNTLKGTMSVDRSTLNWIPLDSPTFYWLGTFGLTITITITLIFQWQASLNMKKMIDPMVPNWSKVRNERKSARIERVSIKRPTIERRSTLESSYELSTKVNRSFTLKSSPEFWFRKHWARAINYWQLVGYII